MIRQSVFEHSAFGPGMELEAPRHQHRLFMLILSLKMCCNEGMISHRRLNRCHTFLWLSAELKFAVGSEGIDNHEKILTSL